MMDGHCNHFMEECFCGAAKKRSDPDQTSPGEPTEFSCCHCLRKVPRREALPCKGGTDVCCFSCGTGMHYDEFKRMLNAGEPIQMLGGGKVIGPKLEVSDEAPTSYAR